VLIGLEARDRVIFQRGLIALILIIVIGVGAAGRQLDELTLTHCYGQAFNITRNAKTGVYTAYLLGNDTAVKAVFPVATLTSTYSSLNLEAEGRRVSLPLVIYVEVGPIIFWLNEWRKQFIDEAVETKTELLHYSRELRVFLDEFFKSVFE